MPPQKKVKTQIKLQIPAGTDEEGPNEIGRRQPGFPDQAAGGGGRSKAAETGGRKRHRFISEEPGSAL
jgi:hypothetical protein